ncbi:MAG: gliding motility-associated C-terminal domain-containing protein [Saprospiraceae bacterium]|nr:gliding motility-associated C-terminal domain-containing protein [Saprospiraceae bacterium]
MILRISPWFVLCFLFSFPLFSQQPEAIQFKGALQPATFSRGACNGAGTTNQNLSGGSQSNDPLFLCFGDSLIIDHNGDFDLSGDPNPGTTPGIGYGFYSCPPSVGGMDLATILTDPCIYNTPPSPTGIWITTGTNPGGDVTFVNDGGLQSFFNGGSPVQIWFAPITVDDFATNGYEEASPGSGAGPCVDVNINAAFSVVYLNKLTYSNLQITGAGVNPGGGSFTLTGGLPEFDGSNYTVSIYRKGNPGQTALITSGGTTHNGMVSFEVPSSGTYVVEIADDTGCGRKFEVKVPGIVFTIDCKDVVEGGTVCLDIYVTNFTDIESFQFFFHFDASLLKFVSISNVPLTNFDPVFSGVQNDSIFFMGYFAFPGESIPDGGLFGTICFEAIGAAGETSPITLAPGAIGQQLECYNGNGVNLGVNFNPGCVTIVPGGPITLNLTADSVSCAGQADGSIKMNVIGGVEPYTYSWAHATNPAYTGNGNLLFNPSNITFPNLIAGVYSVTITDSNNPSAQEIKSILVPGPAPLAINLDAVHPACYGDLNGSIAADVVGGTSPYSYVWSNGPQGTGVNTNNGLGSMNYSVTVTDFNGCSANASTTLFTDSLKLTVLSKTNETCTNGGNDGTISIVASGGTILTVSNYTYDWGPAGTGASLINLNAGFYTVTVSDDNNCTKSLTLEITSPASPTIDTLLVTNAGCANKSNGEITAQVTPAPGASNLTYSWTGPNGTTFSGQTITGLGTGNYFITVVDDNGCSDVSVTYVDAPFPLTISDTLFNLPDCPNSTNGSLGVQVIGGTSPYSFTWSNVGTPSPNSVNFPISSGTYTVTVTDAEGCGPIILDLTLAAPPSIQAMFSLIDSVSCQQGVCDGGATAAAQYSNGTGGTFNFSWSSTELDLGVTSSTATQLCAGQQHVTISDGLCAIDTIVFIPSPDPILVTANPLDISCFGLTDGQIDVTVNGGTPGFTYIWAAGDTTVLASKTSLGTGFYTVTVVDQYGCVGESVLVELEEPLPFVLAIDATKTKDERCSGIGDGAIALTSTGGNPGTPAFSWTGNVSTTALATNLAAGTYTITATDSRGCQDTISYTIQSPPPIFAIIPDVDEPPCYGDATFLTVTTASGGNGPDFTFAVDNGSSNALNSVVPVFADQPIEVIVFDNLGCSWDTLITVNQPPPLTLDLGPDQTLELGDSITIGPINNLGGFTIISYLWSPTEGLDCDICTKVSAKPGKTTNYLLRIEDINGCAAEDEVTVSVRTIRRVYVPNAFSPNFDGFNDLFTVYTGQGVKQIDAIRIYDRWGNHLYELLAQPPSADGTVLGWDGSYRGKQMDPGVYVYVIETTFIDGQQLIYRGEVNLIK